MLFPQIRLNYHKAFLFFCNFKYLFKKKKPQSNYNSFSQYFFNYVKLASYMRIIMLLLTENWNE